MFSSSSSFALSYVAGCEPSASLSMITSSSFSSLSGVAAALVVYLGSGASKNFSSSGLISQLKISSAKNGYLEKEIVTHKKIDMAEKKDQIMFTNTTYYYFKPVSVVKDNKNLLMTALVLGVLGRHNRNEVNEALHLVMIKARDIEIEVKVVLVHLLSQKFVILCLELLDNVFIVKQFFDGAIWLAEKVLNGRASVLPVSLPEVAVKESATRHDMRWNELAFFCIDF